MSVDIRGMFFHYLSWPAQVAKWLVAKWLETWGLSHKVPGSNRTALKLTGGQEHWLGTALVPPLTHESIYHWPMVSKRVAYSSA